LLDIVSTEERQKQSLTHSGLHISGARFETPVDLSNIRLKYPLRFERTTFEQGLWLKRASVQGYILLENSILGSAREQDSLEAENEVALNMKFEHWWQRLSSGS
jgi:hypothetical protein